MRKITIIYKKQKKNQKQNLKNENKKTTYTYSINI